MTRPITDGAEVSIDFPDKVYIGSFVRDASFDATADVEGVHLQLVRGSADRRVARLHLHYYLLADILAELAGSLRTLPPMDEAHCQPLLASAEALAKALRRRGRGRRG
ncbi:MAG: hypothetical protein FJX68_02555 [Alphaproteobacteria bacterium]|nr:hypothetical protein [Alphaproteobacteria bacterium]